MIAKFQNVRMKNIEADTKMRATIGSDGSEGVVGEIK